VSAAREAVVAAIADSVPGPPGRIRVAVDGRGGAGKTMFADELAAALCRLGRPVVRASVDGFHRPRADRYRRGHDSPTGYWLDAYDYPRLTAVLLDPFARGEPVRTAVHDVRTDATLDLPPTPVPPDAVLVLDGIFTLRDELALHLDFSIYLHVDIPTSVARMAARDGTPPVRNPRYVEAYRHYVAVCHPFRRASVALDNSDLLAPQVIAPAR
jgi:uridine kinase